MRACIRDVHNSLVKKDISVTQVCNQAFKCIDETKKLNAYITTCREEASEHAKSLDERLVRSSEEELKKKLGILYGVPISIKDNFCTKHILTTCGSRMLHNFVPSYDATVVTKLKQANCLITGKTNMDEFAMGSSCTTSFYKCAINHHKSDHCDEDTWYMAGGSSTGSAISVATGACFASIGTDTGGSTRQPASLTGVVGFKPTYGLISRFGLIPLAHCLDVVSLLARNVEDTLAVFDNVIGLDENDLTSVDHRKALRHRLPSGELGQCTIRVGVPEEFVSKGELSRAVSKQYSDILKRLASQSDEPTKFELVKISLPHANLATECYTIISSAEIASNMSCYDGVKYGLSLGVDETSTGKFDRDAFFKANRDAGFGLEVKKRIILGNYFLLSENRDKYLVQAQKLRRLISDDFASAFERENLDVIIMPSTPTTSISYVDWQAKQSENKLFGEDYYLIPANIANIPSISLPAGLSDEGLPIGLQLIGNRFHDFDLLTLSRLFEEKVFDCQVRVDSLCE